MRDLHEAEARGYARGFIDGMRTGADAAVALLRQAMHDRDYFGPELEHDRQEHAAGFKVLNSLGKGVSR